MADRAHNVFWLVEILKIFLLETTKPIELWLCRNDHWVVLYYTCESFAGPKNKNIVYDYPMNISAKFDSNLFCGFRKKDENVKFP
jgi:hypothetical protein